MKTLENESKTPNADNKPNPDEKPKRRQSINPMWRILGKARKTFDVQLVKDNEMKLTCINNHMVSETKEKRVFFNKFSYVNKISFFLRERRAVTE
jgi:hypothetical protein